MGTLLCPLHQDSEERGYLDGLNFKGKLCRKATLKTEYDKDRHFAQHGLIYKAVEADKVKQLQTQQMDLMREQTNAMQSMARAQGAPPATEPALAAPEESKPPKKAAKESKASA